MKSSGARAFFTQGDGKRKIFLASLASILVSGLLLRFCGLSEGLDLHPDERWFAIWINEMHFEKTVRHEYSLGKYNRGYPEGYFVLTTFARVCLADPVRRLKHKWDYFTKKSGDYEFDPSFDPAAFGRACNAWYGTLTVLFAALTVLFVTGSGSASLLVATLTAFEAYSIEHAHYLEADAALLLTLAFSLFLIALFLKKRNVLFWLLAAFSSGFAFGTQRQLGLLLPVFLVALRFPSGGKSRSPRFAIAYFAGMTILGLSLFACGYAVAEPDAQSLCHRAAGLISQFQHSTPQAIASSAGTAGSPSSIRCMNFEQMLSYVKHLSPGWIILAAVGIPLSFCKRQYLRYWPVLLGFPALYGVYSIFYAPFARSQEFIPLVPSLALLAALPVAAMRARTYVRGGGG